MQPKFRIIKINIHQICKRTSRISWILFFAGTFLFSCSQVQEQSKIKKQASNGSVLPFPEAMEAFKIILYTKIKEATPPTLNIIKRRTLADAGLSNYAARNYYMRERPSMLNNAPFCTPEEKEELRRDEFYLSERATIYSYRVLIQLEVFSEQADDLPTMENEFGKSRNVFNLHWHSDVLAGRMMGTAAVAALHANTYFLIDLEAAKTEILKL